MALIRNVCDPVTRIEGHLGINIEVDDVTMTVNDANVYSTLYRGFENILKGRDPRDAIQITQRI